MVEMVPDLLHSFVKWSSIYLSGSTLFKSIESLAKHKPQEVIDAIA